MTAPVPTRPLEWSQGLKWATSPSDGLFAIIKGRGRHELGEEKAEELFFSVDPEEGAGGAAPVGRLDRRVRAQHDLRSPNARSAEQGNELAQASVDFGLHHFDS